jgi:membrane fusion protein (multidrug efflux system)
VTIGFSHTLRSLDQRERPLFALIPALTLLGGWGGWMLGAEVDVYISAPRARLEVSGMAHHAAAEEGGRIVTLDAPLGRIVKAGDRLAALDSSVERARQREEAAALEALATKRAALQTQIDAERAMHRAGSQVDGLGRERALLGLRQAEVAAAQSEELADIAQSLRETQLNSRIDTVNALGAFAQSRLAVSDASKELERLEAERFYRDRSSVARFAELARQIAELGADERVVGARLAAARVQVERRDVRAPVNGRIGNIGAFQVGDVVSAGDLIATVVPDDEVHVVAQFQPALSSGQLSPGQSARVRLDGHSWLEYGVVEARVARVASEPHLGTLRVELSIGRHDASKITLQHGLTGAVDIRVGQASPWALLTRSLGGALLPESIVGPAEALAALEFGASP